MLMSGKHKKRVTDMAPRLLLPIVDMQYMSVPLFSGGGEDPVLAGREFRRDYGGGSGHPVGHALY